ncbi:MAG: hypothetical protein JRI23_00130 [Deltaproteobacteria bacterium]|nr:hypothetical protein [Deltaproteobacteria bacterium]MBW2529850.1 hypothetical protein [Deltaproteobacteria bacterium]
MTKRRASNAEGSDRPRRGTRARRELLTQLSQAAGIAWARTYREAVHREGRRAAGGFPGTLSEARQQFARIVEPELSRESGLAASYDECEECVRLLYSSARNEWLSRREEDST